MMRDFAVVNACFNCAQIIKYDEISIGPGVLLEYSIEHELGIRDASKHYKVAVEWRVPISDSTCAPPIRGCSRTIEVTAAVDE